MTLSPNRYRLEELRRALRPARLLWFPRLRSTNDHAAVLRRRGELFAPAVLLTGHQLAGRGRGLHAWWSNEGCITVTFAFAIDDRLEPFQIPLLAGLALRSAAAHFCDGADIALKWPNDLLFNGKKLAGLLCERVEKIDLIGVGLNVNVDPAGAPPSIRDRVTSLAAITGAPLDLSDTLAAVAQSLRAYLQPPAGHSFARALAEYDAHHALIGRKVTVTTSHAAPVTGRCEGLDRMGRLLLRNRQGLHAMIAGHVDMT